MIIYKAIVQGDKIFLQRVRMSRVSRVSRSSNPAHATQLPPRRPGCTVLVKQHPSAATNMSPAAELASHFARAFRGPGAHWNSQGKTRWNPRALRYVPQQHFMIRSGIGFLGWYRVRSFLYFWMPCFLWPYVSWKCCYSTTNGFVWIPWVPLKPTCQYTASSYKLKYQIKLVNYMKKKRL